MGDGTLQEFNARIKALEVHVRSEMMKKAKETQAKAGPPVEEQIETLKNRVLRIALK